MTIEADFINAFVNLNEDDALKIVGDLISNKSPIEIIALMREGMELIGEKFSKKEYYLAELVYGAEIFRIIMNKLAPKMKTGDKETFLGKIVIGTVKNDVHDLGKNLVGNLLRAEGFEVIDLGVDVSPEKFVEIIKDEHPQVVGLSGLLTIAIDEMKNTIEAIKAAGLREKMKIIIGGGPINEQVRAYVGADAFGKDAGIAIKKIKEFIIN